jgi:hypothetical protein
MPAEQIGGTTVLVCDADGPPLVSGADALDLIGEALEAGAESIVVPVQRLTDDFFELSTGVAGDIVQKFANYRRRVAIVGDISRHVANSSALRDFVYEANRGAQIWFVATPEEFEQRLRAS